MGIMLLKARERMSKTSRGSPFTITAASYFNKAHCIASFIYKHLYKIWQVFKALTKDIILKTYTVCYLRQVEVLQYTATKKEPWRYSVVLANGVRMLSGIFRNNFALASNRACLLGGRHTIDTEDTS